MTFLKREKQETKLPYDLAVPILGLHLKKKIYICIYKLEKIHAPQSSLAYFTVTKIRMQPECPLTDEWIQMM